MIFPRSFFLFSHSYFSCYFIADGNPKYLDDEKTVLNFERIEMEAAVFEEIQHYQQVPFRYTPNAAVQVNFYQHFIPADFEKREKVLTPLSLLFSPQNYLTACLTKFLSEKELWDRSDSVKKNAKAKRLVLMSFKEPFCWYLILF